MGCHIGGGWRQPLADRVDSQRGADCRFLAFPPGRALDVDVPGTPTLVTTLQAAGYTTPNLSYLTDSTNYHRLGYAPQDAPPRDAGPMDPLLFAALENTPEPFFLWFHYKHVHLPYNATGHYAAFGTPPSQRLVESVGSNFVLPAHSQHFRAEDADMIRRMYAAGVLRMNAWLERLLWTLEHSGRAPRTSLALTSDHGEELLEHGHVGHASTLHHAKLSEPLLRIPWLIIDPAAIAAAAQLGVPFEAPSHGDARPLSEDR